MIYQLKITLENSKPPVWRRIALAPDTELSELHKIIQTTMGWMNSHLHQFVYGHEFYAPPSEWDDDAIDYTGMKLSSFLTSEGTKMRYEYDFGDSWVHEVKLEKKIEKEVGKKYPYVIKGKRACPPEDCGGIWGYMDLVEIMQDKKHKEYKEMREWLGRDLEPEKFDIDDINQTLQMKNFGVISYDF